MKEWGNLTMDDINRVFKELYEKQQKTQFEMLVDSLVLGFVDYIDSDKLYCVEAHEFRQHGKKVILFNHKSRIHDILLHEEKKHNMEFERLDVETMKKIHDYFGMHFTTEDGRKITIEYEWKPIFLPVTELSSKDKKNETVKYPISFGSWII